MFVFVTGMMFLFPAITGRALGSTKIIFLGYEWNGELVPHVNSIVIGVNDEKKSAVMR